MAGRSARGRWERVEAARRQARTALGHDGEQPGLFDGRPKAKTPRRYVEAQPHLTPPTSKAVYVLTLGEAAARLGLSRNELERMIEAGKIKTLPTQFTRMIPASEVERLTMP